MINAQTYLEEALVSHFSNIVRDPKRTHISAQLKVIQHYPRLFYEYKGLQVGRLVTLNEVESVIKNFSRPKIFESNR